jgi:aspartate-semialdehyde dehydrogenase
MIRLLEERAFPVAALKLLASERSAGKVVRALGDPHTVRPLAAEEFQNVDIVLSSTPGSISREWSPVAAKAGAVVIDNSSAWRMEPGVPLVVPEVNPHAIESHHGIIANPNCSTIQMVVALKPLDDAAGVRRITVSTYQSVSGAGQTGLRELETQVEAAVRTGVVPSPRKFPHTILANCIPQIDEFTETGFTKEELKMVNETRKIMERPEIEVCPTCVRVPVPFSHSESIAVELGRPVTAHEARALWRNAPGVTVVDDPSNRAYPLASDAAGLDDVFVGRVRQDLSRPEVLLFWCVSDNLRKGAATNAVQIAEEVVKRGCYGRD